MSVASVLAPVFVQVALCYVLLFGLIGVQGRAAGSDRATWVSRSYSNQFELPVLFFALVPLALITKQTSTAFVVLEWIYVVGRLAQAAVHVSVNVIPLRGACFFVSSMALAIGWILLFVGIMAES